MSASWTNHDPGLQTWPVSCCLPADRYPSTFGKAARLPLAVAGICQRGDVKRKIVGRSKVVASLHPRGDAQPTIITHFFNRCSKRLVSPHAVWVLAGPTLK